jgi:hypothetical protein
MEEAFVFEELKFEQPLIQQLASERAVRSGTRELLQAVFDHGGYIAGGFGTVLARSLVAGIVKKGFDPGLYEPVRQHLGDPQRPKLDAGPWRNVGCGDIDVWFPDRASLDGFLNDKRRLDAIQNGSVSVDTTVTKAAIEHIVDRDARIQVITRYLMPLHDQIAHFDIYNGMVAVTNDKIVYPEHFSTLEKQNMIHVVTWDSPWTVNRFFKWMFRKGYTSVTPATAHALAQKAIEAHEQWHEKASDPSLEDPSVMTAMVKKWSEDKLRKAVATMPDGVQRMLQYCVPNLTGEQLLQLVTYFKPRSRQYDYALNEIHRRMPPA